LDDAPVFFGGQAIDGRLDLLNSAHAWSLSPSRIGFLLNALNCWMHAVPAASAAGGGAAVAPSEPADETAFENAGEAPYAPAAARRP
jgi:hypothetical protein